MLLQIRMNMNHGPALMSNPLHSCKTMTTFHGANGLAFANNNIQIPATNHERDSKFQEQTSVSEARVRLKANHTSFSYVVVLQRSQHPPLLYATFLQ